MPNFRFPYGCVRVKISQNTHFVQACTVKMHVHICQETSEEPLYIEIYRKNAATQIGPKNLA